MNNGTLAFFVTIGFLITYWLIYGSIRASKKQHSDDKKYIAKRSRKEILEQRKKEKEQEHET